MDVLRVLFSHDAFPDDPKGSVQLQIEAIPRPNKLCVETNPRYLFRCCIRTRPLHLTAVIIMRLPEGDYYYADERPVLFVSITKPP
jgi:hypothetical protein